MALIAHNTQPAGLEPCSLASLYGRVDGRDCGHIAGLVKRLSGDHLQEVKDAHAEIIVGCQCCYCWEYDKRQMDTLLQGR